MLPAEVSVLAAHADGSFVSLLLGLARNTRDQLDVRVADGAQLFDGRTVWAFSDGTTGPIVRDRFGDTQPALGLPTGARLLAVHRREAWYALPDGTVGCDLVEGGCASAAPPTLPLDHAGPGRGFRLALEDGTLRVYLPRPDEPGEVLASGIARIVGVYWVRGSTDAARQLANRNFRGRARVAAVPRTVTVDGALDEWARAAPLVVEAPWQLQSGGDGWSGARDGSFSVAAAVSGSELCFAGRVRDADRTEGDALRIAIGRTERRVPLTGPVDAGQAVRGEWLGAAFELCVPRDEVGASAPTDVLPFAVALTDADPGASTTVLASAPIGPDGPSGELVPGAEDALARAEPACATCAAPTPGR